MALVRIEEHTFGRIEWFLLSEPFLVSVDRLPTAIDALSAAGVTVPVRPPEDANEQPSSETMLRLTVTPVILVGVPLYTLLVFGRSILVTNGAAMVAILGLLAIVRELR